MPRRVIGALTALLAGVALIPLTPPQAEAKADGCDLTASSRDLNGDGYDDLVVGDPYAAVGGRAEAGSVTVLFGGSPTRIGEDGLRRVLTQADFGGTPESGDHFGWSLALHRVGLNGQCAGLAVGSPGEDVDGRADAGTVHYGAYARDPEARPVRFVGWSADQSQAGGTVEAGDRFGFSAAISGPLADRTQRLTFGAPGEDVGRIRDAGAVNVLRVATAPRSVGELRQGKRLPGSSIRLPGSAQTGDAFGSTVVVGRLDLGTRSGRSTDRQQAMIIGAPGDTVSGRDGAGSVTVVRETLDGAKLYSQDSPGIAGRAETGDRFGAALALSIQIGNVIRKLSIGAPGEDVGAAVDAGSVSTLIEKSHTLKHILTFHQDTDRVRDTGEAGDEFGAALAFTDMSNLSVGVPGEDVSGVTDTGAVHNLSVFDRLDEFPPFVAENFDPVTQDLAGAGSLRPDSRFGAVLTTLYGQREKTLAIGDPATGGGSVYGTDGYMVLTHRWQPGRDGVPGPGARFGQAIA